MFTIFANFMTRKKPDIRYISVRHLKDVYLMISNLLDKLEDLEPTGKIQGCKIGRST